MVLTLRPRSGGHRKKRSSGLTHDPDTARDAFNQRIEMAQEKSDFSDWVTGNGIVDPLFSRPSGFRSDQFVSDKARISRSLVLFFFAGADRCRSHICLALPR